MSNFSSHLWDITFSDLGILGFGVDSFHPLSRYSILKCKDCGIIFKHHYALIEDIEEAFKIICRDRKCGRDK